LGERRKKKEEERRKKKKEERCLSGVTSFNIALNNPSIYI